ncbi:MAG: PadR family transcriptional regulator [Patescibacteria group bacterium]|nr:PadR family transcriptional regulator [Patescibacteria group bacterium]MDE2588866.1 PadR family transcriptional regulator [Patescibacteria group bacterium]
MSKSKSFSNVNISLTPQIFYILLSLATKERHGYDILKGVEHDSQGKITLGPGTLYGAIKRMLEEKLIVELAPTHTRRKYYKLTDKGRTIFTNELARYNQVIEVAKQKKLFSLPIATKLAFTYV